MTIPAAIGRAIRAQRFSFKMVSLLLHLPQTWRGYFVSVDHSFLNIVSYLNSNRVQIQPPIITPYQSVKCCLTYCALQCIAKLNLVLDVIANRDNIPPVKINTSLNRYIWKTFDKLFNC